MRLRLIRHAETEYNKDRRYQGSRDIPLSNEGEEMLRRAKESPARVYTSHLQRSRRTAELIFPAAEQLVIPELAEMEFGSFEGKTHKELMEEKAYRDWLDSGGEGEIPGGESRGRFTVRICNAFRKLLEEAEQRGEEELWVVAHGGSVMAALSVFEKEHPAEYYAWLPANGEGFELECSRTEADWSWCVKRRLSYRKDAGLVHLYFGKGRGKSSIAFGTALRALHAGWEVTVAELCKSAGSGEGEVLQSLGAQLLYGQEERVLPRAMDAEGRAQTKRRQSEMLGELLLRLRKEKPQKPRLLVLDEACAALEFDLIEESVLWDAVLRKPSDLELILSGRNPVPWMMEAADYCTELNAVRHPYEEGIPARAGIEF